MKYIIATLEADEFGILRLSKEFYEISKEDFEKLKGKTKRKIKRIDYK